jgi:rare lipoprotein A
MPEPEEYYAVVSWYGPGFHGKRTASGEHYDMDAMTCAHKSLPFGTVLSLNNIDNGKSTKVVVNDRGPFVEGRDIDLSRAAAKELGIIGKGTGRVRVNELGRDMRYRKYLRDGVLKDLVEDGTEEDLFTIQVGSFSDRANAEYVWKGLSLNYKEAYIMEKHIEGKQYYRVRVGKYDDHGLAKGHARRLAEEGYETSITPFETLQ